MVIVKHCPECDKEITKRNLLSHMKEVHKLTNYEMLKQKFSFMRLNIPSCGTGHFSPKFHDTSCVS